MLTLFRPSAVTGAFYLTASNMDRWRQGYYTEARRLAKVRENFQRSGWASHEGVNSMSTAQTLFSIMRTFNFYYCIRKHGLGCLLLVALPLGAQTLNVDMVVPMNTSTPGTAFTTAI